MSLKKQATLSSKRKPFVIAGIIILFVIFAFQNVDTILTVFADHTSLTIGLSAGPNVINYRNISPADNSTATISMSPSNPKTDTTATVTVNDFDANVDTNNADVVTSTASSTTSGAASATITLTETDVNTGTFSGDIIFSSSTGTSGNTLETNKGDDVSLSYEEELEGVGRATITLSGVAGSGSVTISDYLINTGSRSDGVCPTKVVIHPIELDISGTTASSITITMSYANALLGTTDENNLKVFWRPIGGGTGFLSTSDLGGTVDTGAKTVTNVIQPTDPVVGGTIDGQYVLGVDVGCPGGGGGGLVKPITVVNALAGIGAAFGGGSSGPPGPTITLSAVALSDSGSETISMPQEIRDFLNNDFAPNIPLEPIVDTYEDFDFPLSINGNGFALGGYENTLVTQTIEPSVPNEFNIVFYTNSEVAHTSLYFNLGPTKTIGGSDTQVLLYKDKPIEIIDPNGNIAIASGTINNEGELKRVVTFSITFSEDMQWTNSDLVIRAWNDNLNSGDTIVYDAIQIAPSEEEIAFEESIPEPEVEQLKSQHVPIWIKNNASWWSQELIEDEDFVAGLEYLIQNDIVTIPDSEISTNEIITKQIPSWIKNTAGWWSEDQITEKEFIDGIQWLISNGIIKVTET